MANLALNKKVVEPDVKKASIATNGDTQNYTGNSGFAFFLHPGKLTVDLEKPYLIRCIRFLLWDGLGSGGKLNHRKYQYQLAVSRDGNSWDKKYRSPAEGTLGWQIFRFKDPLQIRYARIYGLNNTVNRHFHVVEVEAHDDYPDNPQGDVKIGVDIELGSESVESIPSAKLNAQELNRIIAVLENSLIDKQVVQDIKDRFEDLIVLDQNIEAIRREIVDPVSDDMKKSNRLAVIALSITIIGLIITIVLRFI